MLTLGIDTSNYATSMALFDSNTNNVICDFKEFLPVKEGQLGLRQSDALFHHTQALPYILNSIQSTTKIGSIKAVGVSSKPRPKDGSYMPCFLAGLTFATGIATALDIPIIKKSHQEGHIAAAIFATGNTNLYATKNLVFHISGGTTELLLCKGTKVVKCIGQTTDLYAGQAVDRLGVSLGFSFPAGVKVTELAQKCTETITPKVSVNAKTISCSLSGLQNQCEKLLKDGYTPEYACKYCLLCIGQTVLRMIDLARKQYKNAPVICAGGVMGSDIIKQYIESSCNNIYFVDSKYSSDNAIGLAVLAATEVAENV